MRCLNAIAAEFVNRHIEAVKNMIVDGVDIERSSAFDDLVHADLLRLVPDVDPRQAAAAVYVIYNTIKEDVDRTSSLFEWDSDGLPGYPGDGIVFFRCPTFSAGYRDRVEKKVPFICWAHEMNSCKLAEELLLIADETSITDAMIVTAFRRGLVDNAWDKFFGTGDCSFDACRICVNMINGTGLKAA